MFPNSAALRHHSAFLRFASAFVCALLAVSSTISQATDITGLHPRPKFAFERTGNPFPIMISVIVTADTLSTKTQAAVAYLQSQLQSRIGHALTVNKVSAYDGKAPAIFIGEDGTFSRLHDSLAATMPRGETIPPAQGYVLDITASRIVLAGSTPDGTFNGVSTLMQLIRDVGPTTVVPAAHVWDYPDYPERWVFSQHNLRAANGVGALRTIEDTMAAHKMNGIQQGDYKYNVLDQQPKNYFDSVRLFKSVSDARNVEIIPAVAGIGWSDGILWHDPNLAEGLPAVSRFVIESDTGQLVPDPNITLANGGFESVRWSDTSFTGWSWYDGANQSVFIDSATVHGGRYSARCTSFAAGNAGGNCRFNRTIKCRPNTYCVFSAYVKTQNFSGDNVQLLAAGTTGGAFYTLTFTQFGVPATTNGWMKVEVVFNTLQFTDIAIYAGVWGGHNGTIWWDDVKLQEGGLTNVLRRTGTPVHIHNTIGTREFAEGLDVAPVVDPLVNANHGSFGPYHTPPTLRRLTSGALHNGDTIVVSYYHPFTSVSDPNDNGSVMVCVSEDTLYRILNDQVKRVDTIYHPASFFMGHDEIRNMNHDSACVRRGISPGLLLADNLLHCKAIIDSVHPAARSYVWSDMFDSLHNAHNNYYLINGDLTGDWNHIDTSITIVNWNGGKAHESLMWFANMGFRQLSSPYYDVGNTSTIRSWRLAQEGVPGVDGMMYTTWANDYRFLNAFADYAWSAGPYIIHVPLDSTVLRNPTIQVSATVFADSMDATDKIDSVFMVSSWEDGGPTTTIVDRLLPNGATFSASVGRPAQHGFRYHLVAVNRQGLRRTTPTFEVGDSHGTPLGVAQTPDNPRLALVISPDPVSSHAVVQWSMVQSGDWTVMVFDMLGRRVATQSARATIAGDARTEMDLSHIRGGAYRCTVVTGNGRMSIPLVIAR